jgi:hypothetical protein
LNTFSFPTLESLLIIQDVGIQLRCKKRWPSKFWQRPQQTWFIPITSIVDICIVEVLFRFQVKPVLMVVIREKDKPLAVKAVFKNLLPRAELVKQVYKGTRAVIYGNQT